MLHNTLSKQSAISFFISVGVRNSKIMDVSFNKGKTLSKIIVAINKEQSGSAMFQPKFSMRRVEIMTPTLPRVSARTWRKTPTKQRERNYLV